jgi:hypothetical protein
MTEGRAVLVQPDRSSWLQADGSNGLEAVCGLLRHLL